MKSELLNKRAAREGGWRDNRDLGTEGKWQVEQGHIPKKGESIDYYDRVGDKQYGTVTRVGVSDMTLKDSKTNKLVKLDFYFASQPSKTSSQRNTEIIGERKYEEQFAYTDGKGIDRLGDFSATVLQDEDDPAKFYFSAKASPKVDTAIDEIIEIIGEHLSIEANGVIEVDGELA